MHDIACICKISESPANTKNTHHRLLTLKTSRCTHTQIYMKHERDDLIPPTTTKKKQKTNKQTNKLPAVTINSLEQGCNARISKLNGPRRRRQGL